MSEGERERQSDENRISGPHSSRLAIAKKGGGWPRKKRPGNEPLACVALIKKQLF